MGCITSKPRAEEAPNDEKTQYSWSQREKVDPKDFTIENESGTTVVRMPGSVKGQQFIIADCSSAIICVFDHINTVTVDDCTDCVIFLGPTKGSVTLRNCTNCRVMCASQQFRTRDCRCLSVFLLCSTKPSIESSHELEFGCFSYYYRELADQFKEAGISVFNNSWWQVYDFNGMDEDGEDHWALMARDVQPQDHFSSISNFDGMEISMDSVLSVVPRTRGAPRAEPSDSTCLVIFFSDGNREKRAKSFIREMEHQPCALIETREFVMSETQGQQVFGTDSYCSVIIRGPVIALQYVGENSIKYCQEVAKSIALETGSTGLVYVSSNVNSAARQVALIFKCPET